MSESQQAQELSSTARRKRSPLDFFKSKLGIGVSAGGAVVLIVLVIVIIRFFKPEGRQEERVEQADKKRQEEQAQAQAAIKQLALDLLNLDDLSTVNPAKYTNLSGATINSLSEEDESELKNRLRLIGIRPEVAKLLTGGPVDLTLEQRGMLVEARNNAKLLGFKENEIDRRLDKNVSPLSLFIIWGQEYCRIRS